MLPIQKSYIAALVGLGLLWGATASKPGLAEQVEAQPADAGAKTQAEPPVYRSLLPQNEVKSLQEKADTERHGFDEEDRSYSDSLKSRNFSEMADLAKAIPDLVDPPNAVRALLTRAKLSVRMQRGPQGWRPVRIDGEPYLRAIFAESWIYLAPKSEFRRVLDRIDYPSVRFEVDMSILSSLALDEKPSSRIQGNFIALTMNVKKETAKEWMLLGAWQKAGGGAVVGLNLAGLVMYAYDAYKNRGREDPILKRLQQSPAYKAPVRESR